MCPRITNLDQYLEALGKEEIELKEAYHCSEGGGGLEGSRKERLEVLESMKKIFLEIIM